MNNEIPTQNENSDPQQEQPSEIPASEEAPIVNNSNEEENAVEQVPVVNEDVQEVQEAQEAQEAQETQETQDIPNESAVEGEMYFRFG